MNFKDFLIESADWMIEVDHKGSPHFANFERDGRISLCIASPSSFHHCSKWKVKARAEKALKKVPGGKLIQTFGGYVSSNKTSVAPLPEKRKAQQ